jgi:hypothetical protein
MRLRAWVVVATAASFPAAPAAFAEVYKCRGADGALTYQQAPCSPSDQSLASGIASDYPAPNVLERERLLQREAELYKRLEAQRERLSAEAIARITRPEPVVIAAEPAYPIAWPARFGPRPQRRAPMHGWASERRF